MKTFKIQIYRSHSKLSNCYVTMNAQARDLERVLPRVKKILRELARLPNPHEHSKWCLTTIEEMKK